MEVHKVSVDAITVGARMRSVKADRVDALAESIRAIGLQTPISVWANDDGSEVYLIAGAHRLAAVKKLDLEEVECVLVNMDDIDRKRWEIAENLHRADLTALERDQHLEEWRKLTLEKVRQSDAPSAGGDQPKEKGYRKTAKEFGTSEADVRRAEKVSKLTDEAKETAREVGLDDNRSALLKAAKAQEKGEDASEVLRDIAEQKSRPKPPKVDAPEPKPVRSIPPKDADPDPQWTADDEASYGALLDAWEMASPAARRQFIREHGQQAA